MTTLTMSRSSHKIPPSIAILLFTAILIMASAIAASSYSQHATVKHGDDAEAVRQCMNERGPVAHLYSSTNGRHYFVCQLDEALFGISVMVKDGMQWREITSFSKSKMHTLEQVIKYLNNSGAH